MSRRRVRLSILTISDRCSQGLALDSSGRALKDLATSSNFATVSRYAIVPDDEDKIKVSQWQVNPSRQCRHVNVSLDDTADAC